MSNQFNEELKAFSEKHGAVLLGMHHDIQSMQASLETFGFTIKNANLEIHDQNQKIEVLNNQFSNLLNAHNRSVREYEILSNNMRQSIKKLTIFFTFSIVISLATMGFLFWQ